MIVFSLKLLNNVRKAIAGRKFPHQLAGGVALGAFLGVVPHGNLLALFILMAILCFRVNHAVMAVVAIAISFIATNLDPYSHLVGERLLTHPSGRDLATQAWSLPVMPWTDLNNTVVLGSFVIGLAATLPIYYLTLPLFKMIAPAETEDESTRGVSDQRVDTPHALQPPTEGAASRDLPKPHSVTLVVDQKQTVPPPRFVETTEPTPTEGSHAEQTTAVARVDGAEESSTEKAGAAGAINELVDSDESENVTTKSSVGETETGSYPESDEMVSVETRIDVIRMKDFRETDDASDDANTTKNNEQPMDEALNYLLRQLRHSQERKAAG